MISYEEAQQIKWRIEAYDNNPLQAIGIGPSDEERAAYADWLDVEVNGGNSAALTAMALAQPSPYSQLGVAGSLAKDIGQTVIDNPLVPLTEVSPLTAIKNSTQLAVNGAVKLVGGIVSPVLNGIGDIVKNTLADSLKAIFGDNWKLYLAGAVALVAFLLLRLTLSRA